MGPQLQSPLLDFSLPPEPFFLTHLHQLDCSPQNIPKGYFAIRIKYGAMSMGRWFGVVKDFVFNPDVVYVDAFLLKAREVLGDRKNRINAYEFGVPYEKNPNFHVPCSTFPGFIRNDRRIVTIHNGMMD